MEASALADINGHAVVASSAAWNVEIDGQDVGSTPTAYASILLPVLVVSADARLQRLLDLINGCECVSQQ